MALNSLLLLLHASQQSLKIWLTKSAKKRHLCASISAHSLHGWFLQNLGKDFIRTNMHTTVDSMYYVSTVHLFYFYILNLNFAIFQFCFHFGYSIFLGVIFHFVHLKNIWSSRIVIRWPNFIAFVW